MIAERGTDSLTIASGRMLGIAPPPNRYNESLMCHPIQTRRAVHIIRPRVRRRGGASGFTLIEILVVVSIVAVLSTIAIPSLLRSRMLANESAAVGNLGALMGSLEMYRNVEQVYPETGAWQASMFDNADPDYLSRKFEGDIIAQEIQGFNYSYARTPTSNGQMYEFYLRPVIPGSTADRAFYADHTALIRHCTCNFDPGCAGATATSNAISISPSAC